MTEKNLKIVFCVLAGLLLLFMLLVSRDAGISGDETVHYNQSEMVYNYFSTLGKDQSSLHTPKTHLKYYGQAFDNLTTCLIHWFNIEDIYTFRHLMSSFAGWLAILVTALFAAYLAGYSAAILTLLLFSISPTFLGHAQNNLKDIPFALAYISSIFFAIKLLFDPEKPSVKTIVLLILSMAFSIGIRAGGLIVIFYLGLFFLSKMVFDWFRQNRLDILSLKNKLSLVFLVSVAAYFLGLMNWPYALQNPLVNPWKSYVLMTHYPITIRQIFEGNTEWSDFHPWYYLPKYLGITIPLSIFAGLIAFVLQTRKEFTSEYKLKLSLLLFTIIFPMAFVILKNSNLYGAWRHFLFVYPGIVLLSALGLHTFFIRFKQRFTRIFALSILLLLSIHPIKFMAENHPFYYLYYNQLTGGLKGAYGNYETDYYYHSMRQGAEWLKEYLKSKPDTGKIVVGGNFPVPWYFRNEKSMQFVYFPYENRSLYNWDFAIVANSYIPAIQLKNKLWPPANTIHTILADGVPVCAVIKRVSKDDFNGIQELKNGNYIKSALLFEKAFELDPQNEMICYKFAESLIGLNQEARAEEILNKGLNINPEFETAWELRGDLELKNGNLKVAAGFFEKAIAANRKYLRVYPKLAGIYKETNQEKARKVLKDCLKINSRYKPALIALADSYRDTAPEIAAEYDKLIDKLK